MSENIPPKKSPKKPDFKIRPGFTDEEKKDFKDYLLKHGYGPGGGSFTRRVLLEAIGKKNTDIVEGELE